MKTKAMILAVFAMMAGVAVHADAQKAVAPAAAKAVSTAAVKLSADEQALAAKLNDQNRGVFNDKLSTEQRQAVMVAVKNGANADEAVQHLMTAQTLKAGVVADAAAVDATAEAVK